jgi:putative transposase
MESFWSLLKTNVRSQRRWTNRQELRLAIVVRIERTYHRRRPQDGLGGLTPIEYETTMNTNQALAA